MESDEDNFQINEDIEITDVNEEEQEQNEEENEQNDQEGDDNDQEFNEEEEEEGEEEFLEEYNDSDDEDALDSEEVDLLSQHDFNEVNILAACRHMKEQANASFRAGEYADSKKKYLQVLTLLNLSRHINSSPEHEQEFLILFITSLLNASASCFKLRQYKDAAQHAGWAVDLIESERNDPSTETTTNFNSYYVKAIFRKCQALCKMGRYEATIKPLQSAVLIDPENSHITNLLTAVMKRCGDEDDGGDDEESREDRKRPSSKRQARIDAEKKRKEEKKQTQKELLSSGEFGGVPVEMNVMKSLYIRESQTKTFSRRQCIDISSQYLPNHGPSIFHKFRNRIYCGQYSNDGKLFVSGAQDFYMSIFDTSRDKHKLIRRVRAERIQWTLTDAMLSNDNSLLIYSSITPVVHLYKIDREDTTQQDLLDFDTEDYGFGIWSLRFSADSREIIAGTSNCGLYVYNIERKDVEKYKGHADEVNAVCFADNENSNVALTGSDDANIFIWDRRDRESKKGKPVGALIGHTEGVTYISSKGDGRYIISNGKDQKMKLWDLRKCLEYNKANLGNTRGYDWDYRRENYPGNPRTVHHPKDVSVQTFIGHEVLQTLIRCHFSPAYSTGQRYVYSGSSDGTIAIYDLASNSAQTLTTNYGSVVRDVSWHPTENNLIGSSWDGNMYKFDHKRE